jgi:hypothetical protein
MVEAASVYDRLGQGPAASFHAPAPAAGAERPRQQAIYEMRTYLLHPGYGSVPKLLEAFREG